MVNTHYFRRPPVLDAATFSAFAADVRRLFMAKPSGITLRSADGDGNPEADDVRVAFNGDRSEGMEHEPLIIEQTYTLRPPSRMRAGAFSDFCKTHAKPYDLIVVATLYAFIHHFPDCQFTSDSDEGELRPGFDLFVKASNPGGDVQRLFLRPFDDRK